MNCKGMRREQRAEQKHNAVFREDKMQPAETAGREKSRGKLDAGISVDE